MSEGSFGLVLRLAAIMRSTKSTRFWIRKNPNLQDPGAQAPGKIKKKEKESFKHQAPSFKQFRMSLINNHNLNTIKLYK